MVNLLIPQPKKPDNRVRSDALCSPRVVRLHIKRRGQPADQCDRHDHPRAARPEQPYRQVLQR